MGQMLGTRHCTAAGDSGLLKSGRRCSFPFPRLGKRKSIVREVFKRSLMCWLACLRCSLPSLDPGTAMLLSPQANRLDDSRPRVRFAGRAGTWPADKRCVAGASPMNATRMRELYSSPNGDRWYLCKDESGGVFVLHQANIPSGGQISQIELRDFLARGYGPEQQALLQMIGALIDSARTFERRRQSRACLNRRQRPHLDDQNTHGL
jgi:hypothetical protein